MRGRDLEWRVVHQLLDGAQRGHGGVLLVDGEPGVGKSLLLHESVREAASRGFSLAVGGADELGRQIQCFALLGALHEPSGQGDGGDSLRDLPDTVTGRIGCLRAQLERRIAAGPVLVSLDDLQWASTGTLLALRILPSELRRHPVAWILAQSTTRHDKECSLLFNLLESDGARRVTLEPLSDDAVAGLLMDAFGAPPDRGLLAFASRAAGNPLLLSELIVGLHDQNAVQISNARVQLASDQLPQPIQRLARQRLDDLSPLARHLVETAAVLGRSFVLEDATEMLGETSAALLPVIEEAMDAGIVVATDDTFSFRQDFMWRGITHLIPNPARKALHRQFAEILLNRGNSALSAATHLLEAAHSGDTATLAGLDKAAAATLQSSPQTAARLAVRALQLTAPADPRTLPRSVAAAEALTAAGQLEQGASLAHDALAQPLPPVPEARLRCVQSAIRCASGQALAAAAEAQRVLAQPELPDDLRGQAITAQLHATIGLRDNQTAGQVADAILAAADDHTRQVVTAAHVARAMISWDEGRFSEGLEGFRNAARHGPGVSPDARDFQPLLALAAGLVDLHRHSEAETAIRAADVETLRGIPAQAVPALLRARILLANGRLDDAATEGEHALVSAQALAAHSYTSVAQRVLGIIALRRGNLAAAAQYIAGPFIRMPHFTDAYARTTITVAEAQITEARNGPTAAIGQIREICTSLPAHLGTLLGDPAAPAWLVRSALAAGDYALAARVARLTDTLARGNPGVQVAAAAAGHSLGLLERDPAPLAQAAAQHQDPWARASATEDLGVLLSTQVNKELAIQHLGAALHGYEQAGAVIDMARIRRRLRRLGVRRRHWAPSEERVVAGWESLTEAERKTSELVAQGLNNRQVADQMYVSAHTIASHLRQVFRKLNISSRVELARIVLEQAQQSRAV
jgi:DNA-binding CsgD family transcriptional regulator